MVYYLVLPHRPSLRYEDFIFPFPLFLMLSSSKAAQQEGKRILVLSPDKHRSMHKTLFWMVEVGRQSAKHKSPE